MTRPVEARGRPSYSRRIMSRAGFLLASSLLGLVLGAPGAFAQNGLYPGSEVTVGPAAGGGRVLLYPGGKYERIQPHLLQPGGPYPGSAQPIHLHMPGKHAARREAAQAPAQTRTEPAPQIARTQPKREAPVEQAPKKQVEAAPEPAPQQPAPQPAVASASAAPIPFSFDGRSSIPVEDEPAAQASTQAPAKAISPPKAAAQEKQTVASLPPAPQSTPAPQPAQKATQKPAKKSKAERDLTKRSQILFPHDATEPARVAAAKLTALAGDLSNALDAGADRVQLEAYGGKPGDKSSDARRISLKRALTIRQILIDNGVPSSRIDVRAMGGVEDGGPHDRVDVYTRG